MIKTLILKNSYIHEESGREVTVVGFSSVKICKKWWVPAVTYITTDTNQIFTRPISEFMELFSPE